MKGTIIAAVSPEGVLGVDGRIPWHYPADLRRFKRLTTGGTVIMGRKTHESIGRPLPGRKNLVLTRRALPGVESVASLEEALARAEGEVWYIGGAELYRAAMDHAARIDLTYVPDHVDSDGAVYFPPIDPAIFQPGPRIRHEDDPRLERQEFVRRAP